MRTVNHRIHSAKGAFAENKYLLTNHNVDMDTRVQFMNGLVTSRLTYGCHTWRPSNEESSKLNVTYNSFLRRMVPRGFDRVNPPNTEDDKACSDDEDSDSDVDVAEVDWRFIISIAVLHEMTGTTSLQDCYEEQQKKWICHVLRSENHEPTKILTFHNTKNKRRGRKVKSVLQRVIDRSGVDRGQFFSSSSFTERNKLLKKNFKKYYCILYSVL